MTSNREQQMDAVVMQASGPPAQENYPVSLLDTDSEHGLVTEVCRPVLSMRGEKES